ncbi:MAG: hypothetical protein HFJ37_03985 [Clostridia bacterium]|nr:hypothetical protein [Clostridia bacterium]
MNEITRQIQEEYLRTLLLKLDLSKYLNQISEPYYWNLKKIIQREIGQQKRYENLSSVIGKLETRIILRPDECDVLRIENLKSLKLRQDDEFKILELYCLAFYKAVIVVRQQAILPRIWKYSWYTLTIKTENILE